MNLCEGSLFKKIAIFSIPLMFSNILQVLFNMSDIAVVGKFAGSLALGSVGSTSILVTLFTGLLIGFAGGINALTALYIGSRSDRDLTETVQYCSHLKLYPRHAPHDLRHPVYPSGAQAHQYQGRTDKRCCPVP